MRSCVLTLALTGVLALPSTAQRVEDGRAGDASLRVGSGGYNLPRSTYRSYANEIVTGNVRGGRHFRGESPISSTTDFGSALGSSELDAFRRDSVSVEDVRSGYRSYLPNVYYSQTRTVPNVGSLSTGFRPTDARRLPQRYINLPDDPLYPSRYEPRTYTRQIRMFPESSRPDIKPSEDLLGTYQPDAGLVSRSRLFGVAADPNELAGEYGRRPWSTSEGITAAVPPPASTGQPPDDQRTERGAPRFYAPPGSPLYRLVGPQADQGASPAEPGTPGATGPEIKAPGRDSSTPGTRLKDYSQLTGENARRAPGSEQVEVGSRAMRFDEQGDVYRTMLNVATQLRDAASAEAEQVQQPPRPGTRLQSLGAPKSAAEPVESDQGTETPAAEASADAPKLHQDQVRAFLERPIVTFSGKDKTMANDAFKQAEEYLGQGKYFDAVRAYDLARAADPVNPLVWIGRGHALVGAGDYLSAVRSLEEGLRRFPEVGRFQIDLKAFLSHKDILDIRRADLESRLERSENYRFRFLLGYIEYFSGLEKFGLPNLKRAAQAAPITSPIATFYKKLGTRPTASRPNATRPSL